MLNRQNGRLEEEELRERERDNDYVEPKRGNRENKGVGRTKWEGVIHDVCPRRTDVHILAKSSR
jgi:hypothetical protein